MVLYKALVMVAPSAVSRYERRSNDRFERLFLLLEHFFMGDLADALVSSFSRVLT